MNLKYLEVMRTRKQKCPTIKPMPVAMIRIDVPRMNPEMFQDKVAPTGEGPAGDKEGASPAGATRNTPSMSRVPRTRKRLAEDEAGLCVIKKAQLGEYFPDEGHSTGFTRKATNFSGQGSSILSISVLSLSPGNDTNTGPPKANLGRSLSTIFNSKALPQLGKGLGEDSPTGVCEKLQDT